MGTLELFRCQFGISAVQYLSDDDAGRGAALIMPGVVSDGR